MCPHNLPFPVPILLLVHRFVTVHSVRSNCEQLHKFYYVYSIALNALAFQRKSDLLSSENKYNKIAGDFRLLS